MATTKNGTYYPDNYNKTADVPEDMKKLAESVDAQVDDIKTDVQSLMSDVRINRQIINLLEVKDQEKEEDIKETKQDIEDLKIEQNSQGLEISQIKETMTDKETEIEKVINIEDAKTFGKLEVLGNYEQNGTPSSQNPIEIKTLGGNARNIFSLDNKIEGVKINRYDNIIEEDEKYSTFYQEVKPGEKYVFSFKSIGEYGQSANITYAQCNEVPEIGTEVYLPNMEIMDNLNGHVFEPSKKYLLFTILNVTLEEGIASIQLEKGETPTNYIPFKQGSTTIKVESDTQSKNYTLLIQKEMLKGDYFSKEIDGWEEIHNWEKIDSYNDESVTTDFISTTGALTTGATVYYKLTKTVKIKCTPEQSEILNLLNALELYEGKNKITTIENIALLKLKYVSNHDRVGVLEEKVEQLQQEIESYKNSLPRETQTGEYITMNNTADRVRFKDFVLGGNSKQESRSGKNKLNIEGLTGNYVTDKEATTGTFAIQNSWANTIMTNENLIKSLKPNTSYKCIAKVTLLEKPGNAQASPHNAIIALLHANNNDITNVLATSTKTEKDNWTVNTSKTLETNFTTMQDLTGVKLVAYNYLDAENTPAGKFKIENAMILEATENDETYEQYGASPSPEYPSKIENIEGNVEVTVANKNIANAEQLYQDMLNFNPNVRKEVVDGRNCLVFSNLIYLYSRGFRGLQGRYKENTRYVVRAMCRAYDTSVTEGKSFYIEAYDKNGNNIGNNSFQADGANWIQFSFLTNVNSSLDCIAFSYGSSTLWCLDMDSLEIYEATKAEDYVANEQQQVVFPLAQGQKLMLGDYLADDGIHHVRKQVELDGTENWRKDSNKDDTETDYFYIDNTLNMDLDKDEEFLCTHFAYQGNVHGQQGFCGTSVFVIIINKEYTGIVAGDSVTTRINKFKDYLAQQKEAGTPVIVEYKLLEEETEEYTQEQQEAYNKLKQLTSYAGQTNIYSTNNIKPVFTVTGIKDVNSLITQVNSMLLERS